MLRSYLILNIRSFNDLPHPEGAEAYAPYNWRMTEHWWRDLPYDGKNLMDMKTLLTESWPKNYTDIVGLPAGEVRSYQWGGQSGGPHPPIFAFCPSRPTHDFLGKGRTPSTRFCNRGSTSSASFCWKRRPTISNATSDPTSRRLEFQFRRMLCP